MAQTTTINARFRITDPWSQLLTASILKVRKDLKDLVSDDYKWSDEELARHLTHAVSEISQFRPCELKTTCYTVADSLDVDISSCAGRIKIKKIEYPVAQNPPEFIGFSLWGDTVTMELDTPPTESNESVYIYYGVPHTIDGLNPTIGNYPALLDLAIDGAVAYAAFAAASLAVDNVNIGGANVNLEYLRLCQQKLNQYWRDLKRVKTLR